MSEIITLESDDECESNYSHSRTATASILNERPLDILNVIASSHSRTVNGIVGFIQYLILITNFVYLGHQWASFYINTRIERYKSSSCSKWSQCFAFVGSNSKQSSHDVEGINLYYPLRRILILAPKCLRFIPTFFEELYIRY